MAQMTAAQFKKECARRRREGLTVQGNTKPIKDEIKALGGIWDSREVQWLMPDDAACENLLTEYGHIIFDDEGAEPAPAPKTPKASDGQKATAKQVNYAMRLINQGAWFDGPGDGAPAPTEEQLREMTRAEISKLIDDMK